MVKKFHLSLSILEQKCIDKGLRLTDQRKVIVKLLEETIMDTKFHQM